MSTILKMPKNWTSEEQVAFAKGQRPAKHSVEEILAYFVPELGLNENATIRDVKVALLEKNGGSESEVGSYEDDADGGEEEPQTNEEEGGEDSNAEQPEQEPTTAPDEQSTDTPSPEEENVNEGAGEEEAVMSPTEEDIVDFFKEYDDIMRPGRAHLGGEGPAMQRRLFRTIETILRQQGNDFNRLYTKLLNFVHERRGEKQHFHEMYAFRYLDTQALALTKRELRNFEMFLSLMLETCDPASRGRAVEQQDLNKILSGFNDPEIYQRVMAYYGESSM